MWVRPSAIAWRVSATVSGIAGKPVPSAICSAGMPAFSSASVAARRSAAENDGPSPVVPNGTRPSQPCSISHSPWRTSGRMVHAAIGVQWRRHGDPQAPDHGPHR